MAIFKHPRKIGGRMLSCFALRRLCSFRCNGQTVNRHENLSKEYFALKQLSTVAIPQLHIVLLNSRSFLNWLGECPLVDIQEEYPFLPIVPVLIKNLKAEMEQITTEGVLHYNSLIPLLEQMERVFPQTEKTVYEFNTRMDLINDTYYGLCFIHHFFYCADYITSREKKAREILEKAGRFVNRSDLCPTLAQNSNFEKMEELTAKIHSISAETELLHMYVNELNKAEIYSADNENSKEEINEAMEKIGPIKHLVEKHFEELLQTSWDLSYETRHIREEEYSVLETKLSRILAQRSIALAKWRMRSDCLGVDKARSLAQREGINLGPLEFEMDFIISEKNISSFIAIHNPPPEEENTVKIPYKNSAGDSLLDEYSEKFQQHLLEFLLKIISPCAESKTIGSAESDKKTDSELDLNIKRLKTELLCALNCPTGISIDLVKILSVRLSRGALEVNEKKSYDYRNIHEPEKIHLKKREKTTESEHEQKTSSKQKNLITISFRLKPHEHFDEAAHLRALIRNWCDGDNFCKGPILKAVCDLRFTDKDKPFDISQFNWHKIDLSNPPDLMPWLNESEKRLLGVDDISRFYDDPVEIVEDDVFVEYWSGVGMGIAPEKAIKCEFNVKTSNKLVLEECERTLINRTRSLYVRKNVMPLNRKKFTILKSAHVHGKSKELFEEVIHHECYLYVVPESQKYKMEKVAQEIISLGSQVEITWKEKIEK